MLLRAKNLLPNRHTDDPNLIEAFKPLYVFLSLLGLFPCSIVFPKKKITKVKTKSFVFNSFCAFLMLLFITVYYTETILGMMSITMKISHVNYGIEICMLVISAVVSYFCAYSNRNSYLKILNSVSSTWVDLPNTKTKYYFKRLRFEVYCLIIILILLLVIAQLIICYFGDLVNVWDTFGIIIPELIPSGVVAFYNVMCLLVVYLLQNIDQHCRTLVKDRKSVAVGFITVEPKESPITLAQIKFIFSKTLEIKREINKAFQAPILIITIQTFHTVLSGAHILYHGLVKEAEDFTSFDVIQQITWILYQSLKIYALAYPGSLIKDEETKIGQTLLCIPAENVPALIDVQHFASLMTYQTTQMTVYGYFPLDATLLSNTLAAVVTYLVILVQFDS